MSKHTRTKDRLGQSINDRSKIKTKKADAANPRKVLGTRRSRTVPVVGIGASAGGLEACKELFTAMPSDSGMAFVLIQHLDPSHENLTVDLLGRLTDMTVVQATDQMRVKADFVYVIPPHKYLTISSNVLRLADPVGLDRVKMPIDCFFEALAEDQQNNACGVILSGAGSDGTLGLGAVKASGGVTLAQSPETARFDSMPRSAIAKGIVDFVIPIQEMPATLINNLRHANTRIPARSGATTVQESTGLDAILDLLRSQTHHDFSFYKIGTLERRIERRMELKNIEQFAEYQKFLRTDSNEKTRLVGDMLIGVTSFFREPDAFAVLERQVLPKIIQNRAEDAPVRIWVPGCSTGEEAYSIAMASIEQLQVAGKCNPIQIFATDIEEGALDTARARFYPASIVKDVSPARLERFFSKEGDGYRLHEQVSDSVLFATQNLICDPPFSKLDLISCRNLLIYLEPDVQSEIITLFHFTLNNGGYLFLGSSETLGRHADLFEPVSKKWRVYRRLVAPQRTAVGLPAAFRSKTRNAVRVSAGPTHSDPARLDQLIRRELLRHYAPASVLINHRNQILYFYGQTDLYLKQPTGELTGDLMATARAGLRITLRAVIHKAMGDVPRAAAINAHIRRDGVHHPVTVAVNAVEVPGVADDVLLVSFEEGHHALTDPEMEPTPTKSSYSNVMDEPLEDALKATTFELDSTNQELESSNEALRISNEEAMSMSEEFQATNEELEASKEELQSLNEELTTINSQLQEKIVEFEAAHDDLSNLFSSTDIATLFLDTKMQIKRYTPATTKLMHLIETDIGRSIGDISNSLKDVNLQEDAETALGSLTMLEKEVRTTDDRWLIQRLSPYRTGNNKIEGVVATYIDITERKSSELAARGAQLYAESIVATVREPLLVLNNELSVVSANRSFYQAFQVNEDATLNRHIFDLGNGQWNIRRLRLLLDRITRSNSRIDDFEVTHSFPKIGQKTMLLNACRVVQQANGPALILVAMEDISRRRAAEAAFVKEKERALVTLQSIGDAVISSNTDGRIEYMNPIAEALTGWSLDEVEGQPVDSVLHLVDETSHERIPDPVTECLAHLKVVSLARHTILIGRDAREYAIECSTSPILDQQRLVGAVLIFRDVTIARRLVQEMTHQASHDGLTGLVNRREFEDRLNRVLATAAATKTEHALCYLDLDQFKIINDTCGHIAGDELLRQLAELLQVRCRRRDTLARLGGDEFGILMEQCSVKQAQRVANTLRKAIEGFRFVWEDNSFRIGVSIGLVPITEASSTIDAVLSAADAACYSAKDQGRNRIQVYREDDVEFTRRHGEMQWVSRIQHAIDENRLHLNMQPIFPAHGGDGAGEHFELLVWMQDETGRKVPPGAFLPAAERYNLSVKVDCWVIKAALAWLTRHPERLDGLYLCCINLSGHSLGNEEFLAFVLAKIDASGVAPEKICFEITETAAIANLTSATRFIKALKAIGCRFALDDFGSGLSSFAYLKNLPVDFLKIDGLFVKDIIRNPLDLAMVKSINEIGHVMGKKTIAEWVENKAVLEKLQEIDIDYVQGFGVGRPQPI